MKQDPRYIHKIVRAAIEAEKQTNAAGTDAFKLLAAGECIGIGCFRYVYSSTLLRDCVVKIAHTDEDGNRANVREWELWERVKGVSRVSDWFAPCVAISPNGHILIQQRTMKPALNELPKMLPSFFTDFKPSNYGIYQKRFVCHDYASNLMLEVGMDAPMKRVRWRKDE